MILAAVLYGALAFSASLCCGLAFAPKADDTQLGAMIIGAICVGAIVGCAVGGLG